MDHEGRTTVSTAGESSEALAFRLIAEVLKPRAVPESLTDSTQMHDLGIDSMGVLQLIVLCGERVGAGAANQEERLPEHLRTVGDLTRLVSTLRLEENAAR
jgi:acyl carrier protein